MVWINHRRILNNRINRLYKRPIRLVYSNFSLTFFEWLMKDNQRNLRTLLYEMFKLQDNLAPEIMKTFSLSKDCPIILKTAQNFNLEVLKLVDQKLYPNEVKK